MEEQMNEYQANSQDELNNQNCQKCMQYPDQYINLDCRHNFCLLCILMMETKNVREEEQNVQVTCEICQHLTILDVVSSQALYAKLDQYVQEKENHEKETININITQNDEPNQKNESQIVNHHQLSQKDNYALPFSQHESQFNLSQPHIDKKCQLHKEYDNINYCLDCNQNKLCLICLQSHQSHQIMQQDSKQLQFYIVSNLQQQKQELESQFVSLENQQNSLQESQQEQLEILQIYTENVQKRFQEIIESVCKHQQKLQKQVQDFIYEYAEKIEQNQENIQANISIINEQKQEINNILDNQQVYQSSRSQAESLLEQFVQIKHNMGQLKQLQPLQRKMSVDNIQFKQQSIVELFEGQNSLYKEINQKLDRYTAQIDLDQLICQQKQQKVEYSDQPNLQQNNSYHTQQHQSEFNFTKFNNIFMQNKFLISNQSQQFNSYEIKVNGDKKYYQNQNKIDNSKKNMVSQSLNYFQSLNLRSPKQNSVSFKDNFKINLEKEVVSSSLRKTRSRCQESVMNDNLNVFDCRYEQFDRNMRYMKETPKNSQRYAQQFKQNIDSIFRSPTKPDTTIRTSQQHFKQMSMGRIQNDNYIDSKKKKQNSQFNCINMILENQKMMFDQKRLKFK